MESNDWILDDELRIVDRQNGRVVADLHGTREEAALLVNAPKMLSALQRVVKAAWFIGELQSFKNLILDAIAEAINAPEATTPRTL